MIASAPFVFDLKHHLVSRGGRRRIYNRLAEQQKLAPDELEELNFSRRRNIVRFAYEHTKFYQRLYDSAGVHPNDLNTPSDFEALPIVTRQDLRQHFDAMVAHPYRRSWSRLVSTGGSTGQPVSVLSDRRAPMEGALWRVVRWWGVEPHENAAYIFRTLRSGMRKHLNDLAWWPTRRIFLDATVMDPATMDAFISKFQKVKPTLIQGYVGAVHEFANHLRNRSVRIDSPKAVWVTAAPLGESQRLLMQEVFGAPVYDQYGSCEVPWLAAECSMRDGLHMMHDLRTLEFLDDSGQTRPGQWGKVVVTDMENRVFPLIRYELGDMGRKLSHECGCGIRLPLMDKVRGRQTDQLLLPNGRVVSGEFLTTIFDKHPQAVHAFQVHQTSDGAVDLVCVPSDHPNAASWMRQAIDVLRGGLGPDVRVTLRQTHEIKHVAGKLRYVVSDLAPVPVDVSEEDGTGLGSDSR